jgi:hypothetical protein
MAAGRGSENRHPCHREFTLEEKSMRTEKPSADPPHQCRHGVTIDPRTEAFRRESSPTTQEHAVIVGIRGR